MHYKNLVEGRLYLYKKRKNIPPLTFDKKVILYTGKIIEASGGGWIWDEFEFLLEKKLIYLLDDDISFYVEELEI